MSGHDEHLTVIIVPGTGRRTVSLRLPVAALLFCAGLLAAGIVAGSVSVWALARNYQEARAAMQERDRLRRQNEEQARLLREMEERAREIEANLERLRRLEEQVRRLLESGDALSPGSDPGAGAARTATPRGGTQGASPEPPATLAQVYAYHSQRLLPAYPSRGVPARRGAPDEVLRDLARLEQESEERYGSLEASAEALAEHVEYLAHRPIGLPVPGEVTSGYGWRLSPITGRRHWHGGIDLAANYGDPVRATADGVVVFAGWLQGGYGLAVKIDHGYGFQTVYAHNQRLLVRVGDRVRRGDVVALVGSTGASTGPHVHYEVHLWGQRVDPLDYVD